MKKFLILLILLAGCAKADPVETVIDHHVNHVDEVLQYAHKNFDQTKDIVFLENELEACKLAMTDIKQTYYGQISTCRATTDYYRLATTILGVLLSVGVFLAVKQWLKVI